MKIESGSWGRIIVENASGKELYKKDFTSIEEANDFIDRYGKSVEGCSPLRATLVPIRTDTWENLINDLFLPNFQRTSGKVHSLVHELFALIIDLATLPIRLLTVVFRALYNRNVVESHPLVAFLKDSTTYDVPIEKGVLKIKVVYEKTYLGRTSILGRMTTHAGDSKAITYRDDYFRNVTVKPQPRIVSDDRLLTTETNFEKEKNVWTEFFVNTNQEMSRIDRLWAH